VSQTVLLVEDDYRMRRLITYYFQDAGFIIIEAENGHEAISKFDHRIDLVILDIMMPLLDGWEVCQYIRSRNNVPIIILTALCAENDKIKGFDLGADDYVTKPISTKVLVAKAKALLRRAQGGNDITEVLTLNELSINDLSHEVSINNARVDLSPKEYELLHYLTVNRGQVISREQILDNVWGADYFGDLRTVDTHIWRLREKLKTDTVILSTVRGVGYKLEVK
jgi:two-component system response regulator ResD